jgi:uncharacterized protein (TIGR02231 family)
MKKIISLLSIVLFSINAQATEEEIVKSTISKVTVYSQGAQIFRTAQYSIGKGVTEVILEGVSPYIDANSLQVNATGSVVILDSKYSVFYPSPSTTPLEGLPLKIRNNIRILEDSLKNINYDIQEFQDEIDVLVATKNILANNGAMRGQGKVNDSINLLKQAVEYYSIKMLEINKKIQKLTRSRGILDEKKVGMNQRLIDFKNHQNSVNGKKPTGPIQRITITLKADDLVKGKIDVSYLVNNAGWTPIYDLRSESASGKINLNYKAQVYQNTGVDWDDVRLNISTNNPYLNKTKPELNPWYVDYYNHQTYYGNQPVTTGRAELQKKPAGGAYKTQADSYSRTEEVTAEYADKFVQVVEHMISAEFRIDLPYSIKSNNQVHMVLVKNVDLDANYKYYTVPKYDNGVYLVAQLSKLDELQLVPAKANIFFEGTYMGETYIDPTTMEDTLSLSLGKDPNIIVKRTLLQKEMKEKIVGTKKERTFSYSIEVKNLKSTSIDIIVQDQFPITQNADIEITNIDLGKGKINDRTGVIEWEFSLKPKASKDIQFSYQIKYDKDQNINL